MQTRKLAAAIALTLIAWEIGVYAFAAGITDADTVKYQLAARYSARTSFVIMLVILWMVAMPGLKRLYADERRRTRFTVALLALAVNHAIHFVFIVLNYHANDWTLISVKNLFGALGYLALLLAPMVVWNKKALSKGLHLGIHTFLLFIIAIFVVTYAGRFGASLPMQSPPLFYKVCLALAAVLALAAGVRFVRERGTIAA